MVEEWTMVEAWMGIRRSSESGERSGNGGMSAIDATSEIGAAGQ